jgi:signal peptidase I
MRLAIILVPCLIVTGCGSDSHKTRTFRIRTPAMSPTYRTGARVTVDLAAYRSAKPRRGDVVLFHPPKGAAYGHCRNPAQPADGHPCELPAGGPVYPLAFIHRIAAVGGDWIEIRRNRVFLGRSRNGPFRLQDMRRVKGAGRSCVSKLCNLPKPSRVPDGSYFVIGDNRDESNDSRQWGPVALQWIDGKVGP